MPNGGRGYRWMYQLTGLPGWMRFGFSPGWVGRSPAGLGPGATYLMTGQWPTPQAQVHWQAMQTGRMPFASQMTPEQELDSLKNEAQAIRERLEQIETRMRDLEAKER